MLEKSKDKSQGYLLPKTIVQSDISLEKWNIFSTKKSTGYRELKRTFETKDGSVTEQTVCIGLPDSKETLMTQEAKIFYLFLDLWDKSGRDPNGIVSGSFREIYTTLRAIDQKSTKRFGNHEKKWFSEKLTRMVRVPIVYKNAYKTKDGNYSVEESFTLLQRNELFERKNDQKKRYFALSSFTLHPLIVKSILGHNIKPLRLDVLVGLKKEISIILYRHLDLVMSDKPKFERRIEILSEELNFGASRKDDLLRQLRQACKELEGKDISTGRIAVCFIVKTKDKKSWKLVALKGPQSSPRLPENAAEDISTPDSSPLPENTLHPELFLYFEKQPPEEQEKIRNIADDIFRATYKMGGEFIRKLALQDAILAYKSQLKQQSELFS